MSGCIEGILLGALMMKGVDHARQRSDGAEVTGRQQISIEAQEVDSSSTVEYHLKDPHSLANFLKDADIRLVRAQFIAELVDAEQPLPRRQEAPERALVSHEEVQNWASGTCNATICSISHAWETMEHPDPCRYQLQHIVNRLSMSKAARDCDFWVFYDYISLFQFQRFSEAEIRSFTAAMQNMHVLYAHECTVTLRIQSLTPDFRWQAVKDQRELIPVYDAVIKDVVPKPLNDLKPNRNLYGDRGWCRAEVEWSSLRTVNLQHQRICPVDADEVQSGDGMSCRVPMTPQKFETTMKDSKFTHKADSETVIFLQSKVFTEKVSACESLVLEGVPPAEMVALTQVLPFYKCLKSLKLSNFECNEEVAMAFGEALARSKVESLQLQPQNKDSGWFMGKAIVKVVDLNSALTFINPEYHTFFVKEDAKVVMEALRSKAYSTARLPFDAPVRLQALATALEMNNTSAMTDIDLEGEKIGNAGAEALAEMLKINTSVRSLSLRSTGISDDGAQVLAKSLYTKSALEVLDIGDNDITSLAVQALAEMLKINTSLKSLSLGSTRISDDGAQVLVEALEANSTLKTLVVDHEVSEAMKGDVRVIDFDRQRADGYPDQRGDPGICQAAWHNDLAAVRGWLRLDLDAVHRTNRFGMTPLHGAAEKGYVEIAEVLLNSKASMEAKNFNGNTPLHSAVKEGSLEVVRLLVAARAAVDVINADGKTPLQWAQERGHDEVVEFLCLTQVCM